MKRLIAFLLFGAALIDIAQRAYSIGLIDSIGKHGFDPAVFSAIADSGIVSTVEHWGLFLLGFGILSLALSGNKSARSNGIHKNTHN